MKIRNFLCLLLPFLLSSCEIPIQSEIINTFLGIDTNLAILEDIVAEDDEKLALFFSEPVRIISAKGEEHEFTFERCMGSQLQIRSSTPLAIRDAEKLRLCVKDSAGNISHFVLSVRGKNPSIPKMVINEYSAKGTPTQPDRVEIEIQSDGNMEGVFIADGTKGNNTSSYTFSNLAVKQGDYIVVYWNSEPKTELISEGLEKGVYYIAAKRVESLPTNNGAFVIYETSMGKGQIVDALLYTSGEATSYDGYGSRLLKASAETLIIEMAWMGEPVCSLHTSSTRSISRWTGRKDSQMATDFYIAATRCSSFGSMNTDNEYKP